MNLTLSEQAGVLEVLQLVGSAAFALSTAMVARRRADLFGTTALALIPALGGGSLLDTLSGATSVFWLVAPRFALVSAGTGLVGAWLVRRRPVWRWHAIARWTDAFGLALWTVAGTELCLARGTGPFGAVVLGGLTGVAGGLLRDTLLNRTPVLLTEEFYATAVLLGAALHVFFAHTPLGTAYTFWLSAVTIGVLRGAAIRRRRV